MDKKFSITGIGEILWDMLPDGKQAGGAPGNFCYHSQNFGAKAAIISAVGNDENGSEISETLQSKGLKLFLNYPGYPTGYVSIALKNGLPSYIIHENVAWDYISLNEDAKDWIKQTDAICFGSLAQRSETSRKAIGQAIETAPAHALKVLDINLRQQYYSKDLLKASFNLANVVKLNDEELEIISNIFGFDGTEKEKCHKLMDRFELKLMALTLGSKGSWLFTENESSFQLVPKVEVVDTVGAGDSFTAAMVMGLLQQKPLSELHRRASQYAAKVCTYSGATPLVYFD
ncbi:MAG: carbohydrate kinase [Bacteroidales bacterium]|nr:carbohydrate kinase [Bacteroidales bacterium]